MLQKDGRPSLIPAPIATPVSHARAAAADAGGWHLLFFSSAERRAPDRVDSADAWYGRYDGIAWHEVSRIGSVHVAQLGRLRASRLVAIGNDLYFAYPFNAEATRRLSAPDAHGVVMMSRKDGRWHNDSLMTHDVPAAVDITARPGEPGVDVAIVQEYFESQRSYPAALFVAPFAGRWGAPVRVSNDSVRGAITAQLLDARAGEIVSWIDRELGGSSSGFKLHSAARSGAGWGSATTIGSGSGWPAFAGTVVGGRRTVWLVPIETSRGPALRALITRDGVAEGSSDLALPFDNLAPLAATLLDSSVLMLTGGMNQAAYPPAWSMLTWARVTCSGGP